MDESKSCRKLKRERSPEKRKMLLSRANHGVEIKSESVEMRLRKNRQGMWHDRICVIKLLIAIIYA